MLGIYKHETVFIDDVRERSVTSGRWGPTSRCGRGLQMLLRSHERVKAQGLKEWARRQWEARREGGGGGGGRRWPEGRRWRGGGVGEGKVGHGTERERERKGCEKVRREKRTAVRRARKHDQRTAVRLGTGARAWLLGEG